MTVDPANFRAPKISKPDIRAAADDFREKYAPAALPVDILGIIEFDLDMQIIPISDLKPSCDTEAALLGDLKSIAVDKVSFMDERFAARLRFSAAHEIGHLVLHGNLYKNVGHTTVEEWIRFYSQMPDEQYRFLETHADEFAGRLLVPRPALAEAVETTVTFAKAKGLSLDKLRDLNADWVASMIAKQFSVSPRVIEIRLDRENLWPPN